MLNFFNIDWKSLQDGIFIFSGFNQCSVGEVILSFYIFCMLGLFIKKSSNRVVFLIILIILFFMVFILGFAEFFNIDNYVSLGDNSYQSASPKSLDSSCSSENPVITHSSGNSVEENGVKPLKSDDKNSEDKYKKYAYFVILTSMSIILIHDFVYFYYNPSGELRGFGPF